MNPFKRLDKDQAKLLSKFNPFELAGLIKKTRSLAKNSCDDCKRKIRQSPLLTVEIIEDCKTCNNNPKIIKELEGLNKKIGKKLNKEEDLE